MRFEKHLHPSLAVARCRIMLIATTSAMVRRILLREILRWRPNRSQILWGIGMVADVVILRGHRSGIPLRHPPASKCYFRNRAYRFIRHFGHTNSQHCHSSIGIQTSARDREPTCSGRCSTNILRNNRRTTDRQRVAHLTGR